MTPGGGAQCYGAAANPGSWRPSRGWDRSDSYSAAGGPAHVSRASLGVFLAGGDGSPGAGVRSAAPDVPRLARGPASRNASVNGSHASAGAHSGRLTSTGYHHADPQRQSLAYAGRKPSTNLGGHLPRLSTSSVLSTPAAAFASWLPFGGRQRGQSPGPPRRPTHSPLVEAPASDAGSSDSILGSLWRSISGGPSTQPQPATRPEPAAGDGLSTEQLAIGFVEASGSLALAASYIRPDQMGLLLRHGGTGHGAEPGARSPPMGGGLSGWTPTSPRSSPASRTQRSIPLLVSSPAVLFSELVLGPGESQTFSIRMQLPKSLPPSFRGRVASIAYDLVVVAKRDMLDTSAHCVRIPFRVMAHVGSSDSAAVLSFAGPARMPPGHMQLTFQEAAPVSTPRNASPSPSSAASGGGCVADGAEPLAGPDDADDSSAATALLFEQLAGSYFLQQLLRSNGHGLEGLPAATKPACPRASVEDDVKRGVMSICRRRAPVAFSLSQGGRSVASVWLPKRAYQLGDLVIGKIHLQPEAASIYQVSVWLESVEVVQDRLASYSADRTEELTRKIHAEHHEFCRSTSMLGFALASLPTAAVSFASDIVSNVWQLRIELIAGLPGATASDLGLSATTPFPPEKRLPRSSVPAAPAAASRDVPSAFSPSPPPVPPPAPVVGSGRTRPRSSTIAGNGGGNGSTRCAPLPHTQAWPGAAPQLNADNGGAVTMRRRYDAAREVLVQTLSCTVGIHMYPSLASALPQGQRDSYTVDLTARGP